jgi:hypothetical protein
MHTEPAERGAVTVGLAAAKRVKRRRVRDNGGGKQRTQLQGQGHGVCVGCARVRMTT